MGCGKSRAVAPHSTESGSVDRDEYLRTHPGVHNPSGGEVIDSMVSGDIRGKTHLSFD